MEQAETKLDLPPVSADIDLSVVIVSYNTRQMTIECVASVLDHRGDLNVEIIVVDNCSKDGSAAALRESFPNITVIDSPANGGFAFGNNIGFEKASGRYILLLNPDTRVHPGGLETAIRYMEENADIGIMGPLVRLDDGTQQSSMIRYLSLTQLFFIIFMPSLWMRKTSLFGDLRYADLSRGEINSVDAVSGCFMLARRKIFEDIGGLDQRFFMYGEESEWCRRTTRAGWDIHYNPNVEILHHGAASTAHMSEWKAVEMTRGHILFLRFTRGAFAAWIGTLFMLARDLVRLPYYGFKAILNGFRWDESAKPWLARLKFEMRSIVNLPKGQAISRPAPSEIS
ncbi:glycosyltransferase family 2 protein [Sphingorhabdus sp. Alg239-R122]|uniref:glycosyltransferase family 2 protein n=1 Tax=Sphingorhabdus sp. Alg239-R122 TaxID=2305989 RepID=UPI0013DD0EFC|nr:glycosyltransferase family 2 protein [Sphingorhabdus sp. Alg239-R122]